MLQDDHIYIRGAKSVVQCLSWPDTQSIILYLSHHTDLCVGEIVKFTGREQSVISRILRHMRAHDLVSYRRDQKFVYYSLNKERYREMITLCEALSPIA